MSALYKLAQTDFADHATRTVARAGRVRIWDQGELGNPIDLPSEGNLSEGSESSLAPNKVRASEVFADQGNVEHLGRLMQSMNQTLNRIAYLLERRLADVATERNDDLGLAGCCKTQKGPAPTKR